MLKLTDKIGFAKPTSGLLTALSIPGDAGDRIDRVWDDAGSLQRWTLSIWFRARATDMRCALFGGSHEPATNTRTDYPMRWEDGSFRMVGRDGTTVRNTVSTAFDVTTWQHLVVASDLAQAATADKLRMWVQGNEQTLTGTLPAGNLWDSINGINETHGIGETPRGSSNNRVWSNPSNMVAADVNFLNDIALTDPDDFGFAAAGAWSWRNVYDGGYGASGFRLLFEDGDDPGHDSSGNDNHWTPRGNVVQIGDDLPPQ